VTRQPSVTGLGFSPAIYPRTGVPGYFPCVSNGTSLGFGNVPQGRSLEFMHVMRKLACALRDKGGSKLPHSKVPCVPWGRYENSPARQCRDYAKIYE